MAKTKTKKVVAIKKVAPVVKESIYNLAITICNETFSLKTDEIIPALLSFKPKKVSGKILVTVSRGESSITRVIYPPQARKLFNNKLTAEFFTKNIILQLK